VGFCSKIGWFKKLTNSDGVARIGFPNRNHGNRDVSDQILQINNELYAKGLIFSTSGNISAYCDDNEQQIRITPSRIFKEKPARGYDGAHRFGRAHGGGE
jgi:hypothetical protein